MLGHCWSLKPVLKTGAGDAIRTRDIFLGKEVLYH
jgi:hypothetical protein